MRHSIEATGFGVRLRPVRMEDAPFIVWLRNRRHALGRIGDSATDVAAQERWFAKYFETPGDYYWVVETRCGVPAGTYGLWAVKDHSAESGRWITRPEVPVAIPSAILGLDIAFGELNLRFLRVKTVTTNIPVLSLNRKFGMRSLGIERDSTVIGGKTVDQEKFELHPEDWAPARDKMLDLATIAERDISAWETVQRTRPAPWA